MIQLHSIGTYHDVSKILVDKTKVFAQHKNKTKNRKSYL